MRGARGQLLLETLFAEPQVLEALGWGEALHEIRGEPPTDLMLKLKHGLGAVMKANDYEYQSALKRETGQIERIQELQQRAFALLGSALLALLIAMGNFFAYLASRSVLDARLLAA